MRRYRCATMRLAIFVLLLSFASLPGAITPAAAAEYVSTPNGEFFQFDVNQNALAGAPDRSAMNRPLDASARIYARNGHFYTVGTNGVAGDQDDRRVRLFGVNLSFGANFPAEDDAVLLAKRLRKLGFNAVRLHHLDSLPSDYQDTPLSVLSSGPYPSFNPVAVQRLRRLIQAFSQEGIYVNLNLHVGYRFRASVDGLPAVDGGAESPPVTAPIHVYDPRLIERQERYARQIIDLLGLKDNPSLAMVEINNESSLMAAWRSTEWNAAVPSAYAPTLQKMWQQWLLTRYGSLEKACAAWDGCSGSASDLLAPGQGETYSTGLAELRARLGREVQQISGQVFGTTSAQDAPVKGPALRERDFLAFLVSADRAYLERMRAVVRASTDNLVPVTGTQMAFGGVLNFDSHVSMDYVDEHIYVGHPNFPNGWDLTDWRTPKLSTSGDELGRLLALSLRRDLSRPFVVSEYAQPFPNLRGAEIVPLMSTVAAMQDWDGLFFFDYSESTISPSAPANYSLSGDWGTYVLTGQSAQIFRVGGLAALSPVIEVPVSAAARMAMGADRRPDTLEAGLKARFGVTPELAWSARLGLRLTDAPMAASLPAAPTPPYASVNQQVRHDPDLGRVIVQTDKVWGVFGATGTARIEGEGAWIAFTGAPGHASMMMTPLDDKPLAQSRHMLLSLGSFTTGTQPGSAPKRPKQVIPYKNESRWITIEPDAGSGKVSGPREMVAPTWMLRTKATLGVRARPSGQCITVYPLDGTGQRMQALSASGQNCGSQDTVVMLQNEAGQASPWYEIVVER